VGVPLDRGSRLREPGKVGDVEWPGRQPNGEAVPNLIDLVDRGLIRVIDLIITKDEFAAQKAELLG
jgi:hypothetical protein